MILGSLTLSDDIVLRGLNTAPPIAHSQRRTIGGRSVVQTAPMLSGLVLQLDAVNHLSHAELTAIHDLAAQGAAVTISHHRGTYSVIIIKIEADHAYQYADPCPDAWYSATITMIEV